MKKIELMEKPKMFMLESEKAIVKSEIILPEISREELIERYKKIRPLVKRNSFWYNLRDFSLEELLSLSFIDDIEKNRRSAVAPRELITLGEFPCYHKIGDDRKFNPTIAEVLSQYPDELLKDSNLFYLKKYPRTLDDFGDQIEVVKAGYHRSKVRALKLEKK